MDLNCDILNEALVLLGEILESSGSPPVELVVVGGSALLEAGLISRTTDDVDILARRSEVDREIIDAQPLPEFLLEAAAEVEAELKLRKNWLNASISWFSLPFQNYPAELWQDGIEREYGECLRITFAGRSGIIYLKFHAAIDPKRKRRKADREDLISLAPTALESRRAVDWLVKNELIVAESKPELKEVLQLLGHENLFSRIEEQGS